MVGAIGNAAGRNVEHVEHVEHAKNTAHAGNAAGNAVGKKPRRTSGVRA
ncbi:hypothetical protein [Streptomyces sp. NPDC048338]